MPMDVSQPLTSLEEGSRQELILPCLQPSSYGARHSTSRGWLTQTSSSSVLPELLCSLDHRHDEDAGWLSYWGLQRSSPQHPLPQETPGWASQFPK